MNALFSPRSARIARVVLAAALIVVVTAPVLAMVWVRTPWARGEHRAVPQPVPFDHRVHVAGQRIDCRYCHAGADRAAAAGLPPTEQCVPCHSRVWMSTDALAPVRRSLETGRPIAWRRVTQLADFVYFDHAAHVRTGVGCETCHGRVDRMATARQVVPLTMAWCVDCHRHPEPHLRPERAITAMGWATSGRESDSLGAVAPDARRVRRLTNCTTCHR